MPTGATPALTIGATPAEDLAVLHDKARHITAVSLIGNKTACVRDVLLLTISGFLLGIGSAKTPVLVDVRFRENVLRVKLFVPNHRAANFFSFDNSICDICASGLCSGELCRSSSLVLCCLFIVRRAPRALVGHGVLRYLLDFPVPNHAAKNQLNEGTGVIAEVTVLETPDEFLVILKVTLSSGILARRGTPKKPRLWDMRYSRQHRTGIVQNVLNASNRQGLNAHILAVGINNDHVQQITGKVKHFHTLKNRILAVCRGKHTSKILHLVGHHRQPFQQADRIAGAYAGISQLFTNAQILRDAPCAVEISHSGAFRDVRVVENKASGRMHNIVAVHAVDLVVLRDASAAPAVILIVRVVLISIDPKRIHFVAAIYQQLFDAVHVTPVQRILQEPPVVNQHHHSSAAKEPRPAQSLGKFALVSDGLQVVVDLLLQVFVLDAEVDAVLGCVVRRGINNG